MAKKSHSADDDLDYLVHGNQPIEAMRRHHGVHKHGFSLIAQPDFRRIKLGECITFQPVFEPQLLEEHLRPTPLLPEYGASNRGNQAPAN